MNQYIIHELELFLEYARRGLTTSVVVAATMTDGRSLAAWEVHDDDILDSLEVVKKHAGSSAVLEANPNFVDVLESDYEENTAHGHQETQVQTIQENVEPELREARPEAS